MQLSKLVLPLAFIGLLGVLGIGIWLYQSFGNSESGAAGEESNFFGSLFPFGGGELNLPPILGGDTEEGDLGPVPTIRHLTDVEVAGATFARSSDALVVRYVERETGHTYEVPVDSYTATRLTNTTVPAVHDAVWINASSSILRFLGEDGSIQNFYSFFSSTTPDQSLNGTFLKPYARLALGAGGAALIGITESLQGSTVEVSLPDGTKHKSVMASALRAWIPLGAGNKIYLASAPTSGVFGAVYDITGGSLKRVVGDIPGLEALPNGLGTHMLLSGGGRGLMVLSVVDLESGESISSPQATLVAKCAWVGLTSSVLCAIPNGIPLANYPDDWHLGRVHTVDTLWYVNASTGLLTSAVDLVQADYTFDVSKLQVSEDGDYATFIDRNDGTLWLVDLTARPQE